jgi:predicted RNA-binding protein
MSYASRVTFSEGKVGMEDVIGARVSEEGVIDLEEVGEYARE